MLLFSKNSTYQFLLLAGIIACSTLLIKPTQARAKAGIFGDSNEDGDGGWGWGSDSEEKNEDQEQSGRSLNNEEPSGGGNDHSQHAHHHKEPVLAAAAPLGSQGAQATSWDGKQGGGGFQSANFAAFNESCSPAGKSCPKEQNLECSTTDGTGRCQCTAAYVYVRQTETCWLIRNSVQDVCAHDVQCHAGTLGAHSRCDKRSERCECYDYVTGGKREMSLIGGVCYIKKAIGDLCNTHQECNTTIRGEAYCKSGDYQSGSGQNYIGACQCRDTHMHWGPLKACLTLSTKLDEKCVISEQCQKGSLGPKSKCSDEGTCQCHSPHEDTEVVYYDALKKCFERKEYNETCTDADECKASLGPDVECGETVDYPEEKVCHCPSGRVCRNSAFSLMGTSSYTLGLACSAAIMGVSSVMNGIGNFGGQ